MLKVSFIKNKKFPIKTVQRNEFKRETVVTLKGEVLLPEFLQYHIPPKVWDWVESCKNVEATFSVTKMHLTIRGKAKRSEEDTNNPVFGERVAEARAKINLYNFMWSLCCYLEDYYEKVLYGNCIVAEDAKDSDDPESLDYARCKYQRLHDSENEHLNKLLAHEPDTESPSKP